MVTLELLETSILYLMIDHLMFCCLKFLSPAQSQTSLKKKRQHDRSHNHITEKGANCHVYQGP